MRAEPCRRARHACGLAKSRQRRPEPGSRKADPGAPGQARNREEAEDEDENEDEDDGYFVASSR